MQISQWTSRATQLLRDAGISSANLDADLILSQRLGKPREWLLAHGDFELLDKEVLEQAENDIARRRTREPLAYILGEKEFYGRKFSVDKNVLIPRPESEQIIEQFRQVFPKLFSEDSSPSQSKTYIPDVPDRFVFSSKEEKIKDGSAGAPVYDTPRRREKEESILLSETTPEYPKDVFESDGSEEKTVSEKHRSVKILDVGTGSGALAITAALEFPATQVTASDISDAALNIARQNAAKLGAEISFVKSDLLEYWIPGQARNDNTNFDQKTNSEMQIPKDEFDIILANLPYVDKDWQVSPETNHEPQIALFANDNGLDLIKKLIQKSPKILKKNGFLILEMDPRQIEIVKKFADEHGFRAVDEWPFGLTIQLLVGSKLVS